MAQNRILLTSSEIACLWTSYMNDSMSKCIMSFFLEHTEDEEIHKLVKHTLGIASAHLDKIEAFFIDEDIPVPIGFPIEKHVNLNAPRLYTDMFKLTYINHMARVGLLGYGGFISMSARKDIRNYYMDGLQETSELYDKASDIALSKGLFVRTPYIAYPSERDYVDSRKYLSGFSLFSKQRPLNVVEISHLAMNIQTNIMGAKLALSFAQTSPRKDVQNWLMRGSEISKKHVKVFSSMLLDNNIHAPAPSDISITDSTVPPFSDQLILFHMSLLSATGTGNYATAAAASQRSDLILNYERLSLEIAQYAKDGAYIMIENKWLEQPPGTIDKEKLSEKKE
ncbi:DUF3231 family protein [Mangrovibacillus sp. Mu-81]|jgi:hypothetical protein|uniref:DUF3231 family protein n=1 Tax=Mangrovibacillus sp. Mu-81 TaxID=3121478 RepID=UPI002FE4C98C